MQSPSSIVRWHNNRPQSAIRRIVLHPSRPCLAVPATATATATRTAWGCTPLVCDRDDSLFVGVLYSLSTTRTLDWRPRCSGDGYRSSPPDFFGLGHSAGTWEPRLSVNPFESRATPWSSVPRAHDSSPPCAPQPTARRRLPWRSTTSSQRHLSLSLVLSLCCVLSCSPSWLARLKNRLIALQPAP